MIRKIRKFWRKEAGFTLIEMAIVLFVISVLLLLIVPNVGRHRGSASETGDEALVKVIDTQKELYSMENNGKNASIQDLVNGDYITSDQAEQYNNRGN